MVNTIVLYREVSTLGAELQRARKELPGWSGNGPHYLDHDNEGIKLIKKTNNLLRELDTKVDHVEDTVALCQDFIADAKRLIKKFRDYTTLSIIGELTA